MVRIAVLVSGGGTNLSALLAAEQEGRLPGGEIALVVSSKEGAYALTRAKEAGKEAAVLLRRDFEDAAAHDRALLALLKEKHIELVVLAGYLSIIGEAVLSAYENQILNVHPALIPSFSGEGFYGLRVHEAALSAGVKLTGATVHFVSCEVDGGPIVLQKGVEVYSDDTPETLQRRVMEEAEWVILPEAVRLYCEGRLSVDRRQVRILPAAGQST